jgi:hypothetical protein
MTTQDNYYRPNENTRTQQARLTDWTWESGHVIELIGKVSDLFSQVPVFSRHPYRVGNEENRFKDEIRREPLKITDEPFPVGTVSKTYSLIQHRDVLASVFRALKILHIGFAGVPLTRRRSEIGDQDGRELALLHRGLASWPTASGSPWASRGANVKVCSCRLLGLHEAKFWRKKGESVNTLNRSNAELQGKNACACGLRADFVSPYRAVGLC